MSLMDGLLLDSLLNPPVVKQEIWLAQRTDSPAKGAGTQADPFSAGGAETDSDPIFDQVLRTIGSGMTEPVTIRLQPGTYYTRGFSTAYTTTGWRPRSGMRIVGSGIGISKLVFCKSGLPSTAGTSIVGTNQGDSTHFLDSFELSDITLDARVGSVTDGVVALNGVMVNGKNIFLRRVEVLNWGGKTDSLTFPAYGISAARAFSSNSLYQPYNCVVDSCVVRAPASTNSYGVVGLDMASDLDGYNHLSCVMRNNYVDLGGTTSNFVAIRAGGGIGTIIQFNQVRNAYYGVAWGGTGRGVDMVYRENTFSNVAIAFSVGTGSYIGTDRLVITNNTTEWWTSAGPVGVYVTGNDVSSTTIFKNVVARGNIFRRPVSMAADGSEQGLFFQNCATVIVENNISDVGSSASYLVSYKVCGAGVKAFNNRKPDGTFLAAYLATSGPHLGELTTDVEDALLGI